MRVLLLGRLQQLGKGVLIGRSLQGVLLGLQLGKGVLLGRSLQLGKGVLTVMLRKGVVLERIVQLGKEVLLERSLQRGLHVQQRKLGLRLNSQEEPKVDSLICRSCRGWVEQTVQQHLVERCPG